MCDTLSRMSRGLIFSVLAISASGTLSGQPAAEAASVVETAKEAVDNAYIRQLRGLPHIRVVNAKGSLRIRGEEVISTSELAVVVEATLRRLNVPVKPMVPTPSDSWHPAEMIGHFLVVIDMAETSRLGGGRCDEVTLRAEVFEAARRLRDPPSKLTIVSDWVDEELVEHCDRHTRAKLRRAGSRLAERFSLLYHAANSPRPSP